MLYVFHVDTGTMLTFDMNVAMQSVVHLQDAIMKRCQIPRDKQVLLISGGDNLDPAARVCSYSAGTDSNPIFLFSKHYIESASPPSTSSFYTPETSLTEQVEGCLRMPPTYETVVCRAQLALQFSDVGRDEYKACERLVHDQHLQHQGWAAVIANLDDITSDFRSRSELFLRSYEDYLTSRVDSCKILETFGDIVDLLRNIPVLPCLVAEPSRSETLLSWINAQDKRNTLEQMVQQCVSGISQYDEQLRDVLASEINTMLAAVDNTSMKEVRGLEDRLSGLEQLMFGARKIVDEQVEMAQGFVQNQARARNLQDPSILPDLCTSHRRQLSLMLNNHQSLQDIHRRCIAAKDELSANLHTRLRWVMYVEKSICDLDNKLVIRHETLKKIKHRVEILRQIADTPKIYCQALVEVVRRRRFSTHFTQWAGNLFSKHSLLYGQEKEKRLQFEASIGKHFLKSLFPGFEDIPPCVISKCPEEFDSRLPAVSESDIESLQKCLPQLSDLLRVPPEELLLDIVGHSIATSPLSCEHHHVEVKSDTLKVTPGAMFSISSQSVEIITSEESHVFELEALATTNGTEFEKQSDKQPKSNTFDSPDDAQAFMTADFYIDESLPSSPATDPAVSRKFADLNALLQDKTAQVESANQQVSELRLSKAELTSRLTNVYLQCRQLVSLLANSLHSIGTMANRKDTTQGTLVSDEVASAVPVEEVCGLLELVQHPAADSEMFENKLKQLNTELEKQVLMFKGILECFAELESLHQEKCSQCDALMSELSSLRERHSEELTALISRQKADSDSALSELQSRMSIELQQREDEIIMLKQNLSEQERAMADLKVDRELVLQRGEERLTEERLNIERSLQQKHAERTLSLEEELKRSLNEKHCQELDALRRVHDEELEELKKHQAGVEREKNEFELQLNLVRERCSELETELGNLRTLSEESKQQIESRHNQVIVELRQLVRDSVQGQEMSPDEDLDLGRILSCLKECIDGLKQSLADINRELDRQMKEWEMKLEHCKAQQQLDVEELRCKQQCYVEELEEKHKREVDELQKNHSEEISELKRKHELEVEEVQRSQTEISELKAQCQAKCQEFDDLSNRHATEVSSLHSKHQLEIEELRASWCKEVEELRTASQLELEELQKKCQDELAEHKDRSRLEIEETTSNWRQEVNELKRGVQEVEELKTKLDEISVSHGKCQVEIEELQQKHLSEIEELNANHQRTLDEQKTISDSVIGELNRNWQQEVAELKMKHNEALEDLRVKHEAKCQELKGKCQSDVDEVVLKWRQEVDELQEKQRQTCENIRTHNDTEMEELRSKFQQEIEFLKDQHSKEMGELTCRHEQTVHELKLSYEKQLLEVSARITIQPEAEDTEQMELLLEDYLPMQRHEQIVAELNASLSKASEEQRIAVEHAVTELTDKHKHDISELMNKHEQEVAQLVSLHQQAIQELKASMNKHQQELLMKSEIIRKHEQQDVCTVSMTESFIPASCTDSVYGRTVPPHWRQQSRSEELWKLEQKINEMSLSQSSRELVKDLVTMRSCREGDVVVFTWEEVHGHYVACLNNPDMPKHFLHHDCLEVLNLKPDVKSSIVLQITSRDYCLAKKATNRFKVPVGTKFYRVRAKTYTAPQTRQNVADPLTSSPDLTT